MLDDECTAIAVTDPFAKRLMTQYIDRRVKEFKLLNSALVKGDFAAIAQTAHKLYGSGSAYGLDEITRIGGALEEAAKSRKFSEVAELIKELENFVLHLNLA